MANLNLCQFIGNVGKIETRYAGSGEAVSTISLACNESWKDKNSGEKKEKTEWIRVVMFGKVAEIAQKYVSKGDAIYISGKFTTRKFTNKDGVEQYTTEIRAEQMQMLGGKSESSQDRPSRSQEPQRNSGGGSADFDSDIPFSFIGRGLSIHSI